MDISSTTDTLTELNLAKQRAEEKRLLEERLAKAKNRYDQLLKDKSAELDRIKRHMEEQICKECKATVKANEHQLQTIMLELRSLKEKQDKDYNDRKVGEKALIDNIKASIDPILKSDFKASEHVSIGARIKGLQEEVTNYCPRTVNKKRGAAVATDDMFDDLTFGTDRNACHIHFASTPVKPDVSNININITPPRVHKEETIAKSMLQNTMQTLASEFKCSREPKIQKFPGGGTLHLGPFWSLNPGYRISKAQLRIET